MAKKRKIQLQFSDELEAIDEELTEAMATLDATNEQVSTLLASCAPPDAAGAREDAVAEEPADTPSDAEPAPESGPAPPSE